MFSNGLGEGKVRNGGWEVDHFCRLAHEPRLFSHFDKDGDGKIVAGCKIRDWSHDKVSVILPGIVTLQCSGHWRCVVPGKLEPFAFSGGTTELQGRALAEYQYTEGSGWKEKVNFVAFGQDSYCCNKTIETSTYFHTKCSELSLAGSVCYGASLCETPFHEHQIWGSMSS